MQYAINDDEAATVGEISVMALSVKEVNFISTLSGFEHSIFREVIGWSFPLQNISGQTVGILFSRRLLFLSHEENDFVVVARRDNTTSDRVETAVTPQLSQSMARVCGSFMYLDE